MAVAGIAMSSYYEAGGVGLSARRFAVTTAVQQLLTSFEALTDIEKCEAADEVLRRSLRLGYAPLPDEALVAAAEGTFLDLDAREAADANP